MRWPPLLLPPASCNPCIGTCGRRCISTACLLVSCAHLAAWFCRLRKCSTSKAQHIPAAAAACSKQNGSPARHGCKQVASARSAAMLQRRRAAAHFSYSCRSCSHFQGTYMLFRLQGLRRIGARCFGGMQQGGARRHRMPCSARSSCVCLPCKVYVLMGGCSNMAGCRKPHRHHPSPSCRSSLSPCFARTGSHSA